MHAMVVDDMMVVNEQVLGYNVNVVVMDTVADLEMVDNNC